MIPNEKKKLLLEQIVYNAAIATGDTSEIMPELEQIKSILGIEIKDIAENNRRLQEKERENEKEKAASELAALGASYAGADQGKRQELIEAMRREYETLKKTAAAGPKGITSKELMQKHFPPRKWAVENLIGPGLSILSGASKIGKSWLLFALAESASTGGKFLDHYAVNKTPVLHLSLEDDEQGIKERREILAQKQGGFSGNDDLIIFTKWDTGPDGLETYLRAHNGIKFVIIDTLGQFLPDIEDMNDYAPAVKALTGIKRIAGSLDIAILAVHHARKGSGKEKQGDWMDQSLGSQGIVGSADTIILLQRDIATKTGERLNTGKLYVTGRSVKDQFHNVKFYPDFGMWGITGKGKEPEPRQAGALGENNKDIIDEEWKRRK